MIAITIGNFDGVHRGHVALVRSARAAVGVEGRVVAITFEPLPIARLRPNAAPPRLTLVSERHRLLLEVGCDEVVELDPAPELLSLEPEPFLLQLRDRVPFAAIVEGADFRFGRGRAGSIDTLHELGKREAFDTRIVAPVDVTLTDRTVVRASSSLARWLIGVGRVRDAATVLGRSYELVGATTPGDRRGRTIGYPTLNLAATEQLLPMDGVYGGIVRLPDGYEAIAAISIGTKPHFGHAARTCEAHLLDTLLPLDWYGASVRIRFVTWIREQRTFASLEGLLERIRADIHEIRARVPAPITTGATA